MSSSAYVLTSSKQKEEFDLSIPTLYIWVELFWIILYNFEVAMKRDKREKGIFIGFDFSRDALKEIRRVEREEGLFIEPKTVNQIVEDQLDRSLL